MNFNPNPNNESIDTIIAAEDEKMQCNQCLGICKCYDERKKTFTVKKQNHHPNVYSYCVVDKNGKIREQESQVCLENRAHVKLLKCLLDIQKNMSIWRRVISKKHQK